MIAFIGVEGAEEGLDAILGFVEIGAFSGHVFLEMGDVLGLIEDGLEDFAGGLGLAWKDGFEEGEKAGASLEGFGGGAREFAVAVDDVAEEVHEHVGGILRNGVGCGNGGGDGDWFKKGVLPWEGWRVWGGGGVCRLGLGDAEIEELRDAVTGFVSDIARGSVEDTAQGHGVCGIDDEAQIGHEVDDFLAFKEAHAFDELVGDALFGAGAFKSDGHAVFSEQDGEVVPVEIFGAAPALDFADDSVCLA